MSEVKSDAIDQGAKPEAIVTTETSASTPNPEAQSPEPEAGAVAPFKPFLVCVLYYGAIDREHQRCVEGLKGQPEVLEMLEMSGCSYIDIGRSIAATMVLDRPELGGVLFIDHDMIFDPEVARSLIRTAAELDGATGAAYSMRRPGKIIGAVDGKYLTPGEKVTFFEGGSVRRANYLGMGMTAIPRSAFVRLVEASKKRHAEKLARISTLRTLIQDSRGSVLALEELSVYGLELLEQISADLKPEELPRLKSGLSDAPVVPFFSLLQREGTYYGEDVSFCVRAHADAEPIYLDTRARVYHKGSYCYGLEDVGMEVPHCTTLECLDMPNPEVANAPLTPDLQKIADAHGITPEKRPVILVTATRLSLTDFWAKSLLGRSLTAIPLAIRPTVHIVTENTEGLPAVYNRALDNCPADALCLFVHDDVFIHDVAIVARLREAHQHADIVGLAGSLVSDSSPSWLLNFDENLTPLGWRENIDASGYVSHCAPDTEDVPAVQLTHFGPTPAMVTRLDGLFLSIDVGALQRAGVRFDERFTFHLYDMDFCRAASLARLRLTTWPIIVTHASGGNFSTDAYRTSARQFMEKWQTAAAE